MLLAFEEFRLDLFRLYLGKLNILEKSSLTKKSVQLTRRINCTLQTVMLVLIEYNYIGMLLKFLLKLFSGKNLRNNWHNLWIFTRLVKIQVLHEKYSIKFVSIVLKNKTNFKRTKSACFKKKEQAKFLNFGNQWQPASKSIVFFALILNNINALESTRELQISEYSA